MAPSGAATVLCTDGDEYVVDLARENIARNMKPDSAVGCQRLLWYVGTMHHDGRSTKLNVGMMLWDAGGRRKTWKLP